MLPPSDGASVAAIMFLLRSAAVLSHVLTAGFSVKGAAAGGVKKASEGVLFPQLRNMSYSVIEKGSPYSADYRVYIREWFV